MRMGSGAGFSSDRLGPAIDLAEKAALDWLVFETIGERTLAFGHRDRKLDARRGYNPQLAARMRGVLSHCRTNQTRIMTNMGVANVEAAAEVVIQVDFLALTIDLNLSYTHEAQQEEQSCKNNGFHII